MDEMKSPEWIASMVIAIWSDDPHVKAAMKMSFHELVDYVHANSGGPLDVDGYETMEQFAFRVARIRERLFLKDIGLIDEAG